MSKTRKRVASDEAPQIEGRPPARPPRAPSAIAAGTAAAAADRTPREERDLMIAIAAYYRAEHRGFAPGCELEDWLAAEAEIEARPAR